MKKKFDKGFSRKKILRQELVKAGLLWLFAMFFYVFLAQWGPSKQWVETGTISIDWRKIYHADQFANIAWAIAISAIVFYFANGPNVKNVNRVIVSAFIVIGLICIFIAQLVYLAANNYWGIDFHTGAHTTNIGIVGWWDYIARLFVNQFVAVESPLLPNLAYSCSGAIIGIVLANPNMNRKRFLKWGYIIGGINVLFSAFWLFIIEGIPANPFELVDFHVHPTYFVFLSIGLQLIVIISFLRHFELNPNLVGEKKEKFLKSYQFSRRIGAFSLSVYSLASIQIFLRFGLWGIFTLLSLDNADMFRTSLGLPTGWTFILILLEIGMWRLILWGWAKINFVGSLDWLFRLLLNTSKKRTKTEIDSQKAVISKSRKSERSKKFRWIWEDPLNSREILLTPNLTTWNM